MGRYSSVQSYADNNRNVQSIPYDQASGKKEGQPNSVKAEKVVNPYGSTAGAGSSEFHVYRHARAREMERWKQIDEAETQKKLDAERLASLTKAEIEQEQKTAKKRRKRQREKEAKARKKNLKAAGVDLGGSSEGKECADGSTKRAKSEGADGGDDDDEFTYTPLAQQQKTDEAQEGEDAADLPKVEIRNDGSFLETMKKAMEQKGSAKPSTT
mmetsp:Transcript_20072/g.56907  ORF Transcript_20072/g.56907 Transcript_20072/m.56907 type:complete len:213 (-) Transcript_20072:3090-3728(-)